MVQLASSPLRPGSAAARKRTYRSAVSAPSARGTLAFPDPLRTRPLAAAPLPPSGLRRPLLEAFASTIAA